LPFSELGGSVAAGGCSADVFSVWLCSVMPAFLDLVPAAASCGRPNCRLCASTGGPKRPATAALKQFRCAGGEAGAK
jgi:hypothetical protein